MKTQRLALVAALLLTGCGTVPTTAEFSLHAKAKAPVVDASFRGTGAIAMAFQFPEREGYSVQAVGADIEKLVVTVKTRSFLLEKVVATTTVARSAVKNGLANVKFDQLKAGTYTVSIQALDASGKGIGQAEGTSAVTEGKVSPLAINLQLDGGSTTGTGDTTGGIAVTIHIVDGSATPVPVPVTTPVPTPVPVSGGSFRTEANVLRTGAFSGCLFGASTPSNHDSATTMATTLGRELDVNHSFYRWDDTVPSAEDKADLAAGRVPFISFNAITKAGAPVKWAAIAAGQEDAKLHEVAKGLKALGKPVFFTFNHEPENDQVKGTEADYRAAWKHVADVLKADGATNVVKVLVLMSGKIGTNDGYYPGDDVIDYVGGDTYNWAFSSHSPNAKWRSFEEAATPFYTWAKAKHKPILIAETGCVEDPTNPTHKAEWLKQMGETIKKWPELKAVCYFNNADAGDLNGGWYLGTAPAIAAFKQLAQDPYFSRH